MPDTLHDICALIGRHSSGYSTVTAVPRLEMRVGTVRTDPFPAMYRPILCFVLQGSKKVTIGNQSLALTGQSYLVISVDLPATGQIIEATEDAPYIAVSLSLDPAVLAELLIDMPPRGVAEDVPSFSLSPLSGDILEPLSRLLRLLDHPDDIAILAPMIEREILYRVFRGPQGFLLREIALADSRLAQVRRAIHWIRENYAAPLSVEHLAGHAGMSVSTFHRHFKAVTALSPLNYHKQIRLQEARRRLLAEPGSVTQLAFAVGYESVSQFNREYARQFGLPPGRDAQRLRSRPEAELVDI